MNNFSNHKTSSTQLEYIDLLIGIRDKIATNRYYLLMASKPGGTAKGTFALQFSEAEKASVLKTLSLGARLAKRPIRLMRGPSREQQELAAFGKKLFDGLMQSQDIHSCYERTMNAMWDDRDKGIRLRLVVTDSDLQTIPWELLHDGDRFLTVSGLTPLVRFIDLGRTPGPLKIEPPLRLLVASACPLDQTPLGVVEEKRVIERAVEKSRGLIEVTFLDNTSLDDLYRKLRDASAHKPYHALHFIGHGGYKDGQSELIFEGQGRTDDYIDSQELVSVLLMHRHLRLVVLNACEGSRSFTLSLLKAGIPAVLAMQFPISDEAATRFSEEFYYSLALGSPVDVALGEARTRIYVIEGSVEFATPVLYMHSRDGKLFDLPNLPERAMKSVEQRAERKKLGKEKGDLGGRTPTSATFSPQILLLSLVKLFFNFVLGAVLALIINARVSPACVSPHGFVLSLTVILAAFFLLFWRYLGPAIKGIGESIKVGPVTVPNKLIDALHPWELPDRTLGALATLLIVIGILGLSPFSPFRISEPPSVFQNFVVRYADGETETFVAGDLVKIPADTRVLIEAVFSDQGSVSCTWSTMNGTQHPTRGCATQYSPPLGEDLDVLNVLAQSPCKTQQTFVGLSIEVVPTGP